MKIKIRETALRLKGWSLYRLAQEMNIAQQTVYSWATGRTQPNYQSMDRLCETLDCTLSDLFHPEHLERMSA